MSGQSLSVVQVDVLLSLMGALAHSLVVRSIVTWHTPDTAPVQEPPPPPAHLLGPISGVAGATQGVSPMNLPSCSWTLTDVAAWATSNRATVISLHLALPASMDPDEPGQLLMAQAPVSALRHASQLIFAPSLQALHRAGGSGRHSRVMRGD